MTANKPINMQLPNSLDAEQIVLKKIINNHNSLSEVQDILNINDFYYDRHKCIYQSLIDLSSKNSEIDLVTLLDYIKTKGNIKECGGISYVTDITCSALTLSDISNHIKIIKEKSDRRNLIKTSNALISKSYDGEDISTLIDFAEDNLYRISNSKSSGDIVDISEALNNVLTKIEANYNNPGKILGVSTGYSVLDQSICGLQKGDLIITAARPSMGKTAFALNIGQLASRNANVAIFSLEMTQSQLMERLLSAKCLIDFNNIKTGNLEPSDFEKITKACTDLSNRNIFIDDKSVSLDEIRAKCRHLKIKNGLDVVIIDYLQLIELNEKFSSREQEVSKISKELKKIAKKLDITIIALSQLSRASEARHDKRPLLSDLRESGAIEQDADIILMLYRDAYYNKDTREKDIAEIIVSKNRNGEVKTLKLGWFGKFQRFSPLKC